MTAGDGSPALGDVSNKCPSNLLGGRYARFPQPATANCLCVSQPLQQAPRDWGFAAGVGTTTFPVPRAIRNVAQTLRFKIWGAGSHQLFC